MFAFVLTITNTITKNAKHNNLCLVANIYSLSQTVKCFEDLRCQHIVPNFSTKVAIFHIPTKTGHHK